MPNILALDTSSDYCSVSLYSKGKLSSQSELAPRSHTQLLLPMAKQIVENAELQLKDLDAIAFGCGPGSFTGLRIAAGVAQGLAYGLGCSVFPISNLQAMALQCYKQSGQKNVLVALDARMNEVYWSVVQINVSEQVATVETIGSEHVSTPETVFLLDDSESEQFAGIGSGFDFFKRFPIEIQQRVNCLDSNARPKADEICALALHAIQQGKSGELKDAMPSYIRDKVTWQKLPGRE
ncbi:MAG: tRNA threonylcarbamoyladenosine biosynthesis protein TsaB [Oleiphilaceae bacterium]|jgi:tRNA threonylcarbamoyladenosine biosynthesis protein TsaB